MRGADQISFHSCCGKDICNGCTDTMKEREGANILCAFCRTPYAEADEEAIRRTNNLINKGTSDAFNQLYRDIRVCRKIGQMQMNCI